MSATSSVLALVLAAVFAGSALSKLRGNAATGDAFVGLGVPRAAVVPVAIGESVLAGALILRPKVAAALAVMVLLAFSAVLVMAVTKARRAGRTVRCGCFGAVGNDEVDDATFARNAALVGAAALVARFATRSQSAFQEWTIAGTITGTAIVAIAAVLCALVKMRSRTTLLPGLSGSDGRR